ncbi:MAG: hypothetical protein H6725_00895 [Sandaracinaceae bacterium]|nr:hypothetical protein [Sandaracinaceae bacterium]
MNSSTGSSTRSSSPNSTSASTRAPLTVAFDPTPPLGADILALFRGPFAEVRFPDVDRDSLEADAHALLSCQVQVESLERALEAARHDTKEAAAQLLASAGRALAYAKVFAMGQPALEAALSDVRALQGESTGKERGPKKRRATRASASVQLPIQASSESHPEAAPSGETETSSEHVEAAE